MTEKMPEGGSAKETKKDTKKEGNEKERLLLVHKKEMQKYPLLEPDEELALARKMKAGDSVAREKFINSNLRLVWSIANRFHKLSGLDFLDLVQEGTIGLIKAVDGFDPELKFRFSTYADRFIISHIQDAIDNRGRTIHIPANVFKEFRKVLKTEKDFTETKTTDLTDAVHKTETVSFSDVLKNNPEKDDVSFDAKDNKNFTPEQVAVLRKEYEDISKQLEPFHLALTSKKVGVEGEKIWNILLKKYGFFDLDSNEVPTLIETAKAYGGSSRQNVKQICQRIWKIMAENPETQNYTEEWFINLVNKYRFVATYLEAIDGKVENKN